MRWIVIITYLRQLFNFNKGEGRKTRLALWDDPADDVTGVIARCQKVAGTFSQVCSLVVTSSVDSMVC